VHKRDNVSVLYCAERQLDGTEKQLTSVERQLNDTERKLTSIDYRRCPL